MAFVLKIVSEGMVQGRGGDQPVIERGLECALEMLGNFAREREGRKCITRLGAWLTSTDSALKSIQNAIMSAADDLTESSSPVVSSDCLRHVLVLLCRLYA